MAIYGCYSSASISYVKPKGKTRNSKNIQVFHPCLPKLNRHIRGPKLQRHCLRFPYRTLLLKKKRMGWWSTHVLEVKVSSFIQLPLASDHKERYLALYVLQKFIDARWYKLPLQRVPIQRLPIYRTENGNQQWSNGGLTMPRPHLIRWCCTFWAGAVGTGILYEMHPMLAQGPFRSSLHSSAST